MASSAPTLPAMRPPTHSHVERRRAGRAVLALFPCVLAVAVATWTLDGALKPRAQDHPWAEPPQAAPPASPTAPDPPASHDDVDPWETALT